MTFDLPLAFGGLLVGIIVGLTGMGGGALMTPMLVFFFGADPLTAISSDLVASFVMKPAGALVQQPGDTASDEYRRRVTSHADLHAAALGIDVQMDERGRCELAVLLLEARLVQLVRVGVFAHDEAAHRAAPRVVRPRKPRAAPRPVALGDVVPR